MRVVRFSFARLRDEEHGAVLAIVAISLIVLSDAGADVRPRHGVALKRTW
jgi:hypothetical protein